MLDFIRVAAAVPAVRVGDVAKNTQDICEYIQKADKENADVLVFPELCLTGYSCKDLFFQSVLQEAVKTGLEAVAACSARFPRLAIAVGLPVWVGMQMFNCAALVYGGKVHGLVPKTYLPNQNEFSEKRWFSSGLELKTDSVHLGGSIGMVPISTRTIFHLGEGTMLGMEICEDLWSPVAPSAMLALNGAEVILNLSASPEAAGKREFRRGLVKHQSSALTCAYAYCSAGYTESTQDGVFSGQCIFAEDGTILQETLNPIASGYLLVQDFDLGRVRADRRRNHTFQTAAYQFRQFDAVQIPVCNGALRSDGTGYPVKKLPFVPSQEQARNNRCQEVFQIQVAGLKQRLSILGNSKAVIGISGGLDSTLALLVAVEAMKQLGRPASDVCCITMPCFGTSDRTYHNAWELMKLLGVTGKEINIRDAVNAHFAEIGHDPGCHNATFENAQARERTQILMDYASVVGGIVIGTGDLSELALGWCTYNGDHMSMYGVNASVPKTLIRWIIHTVAQTSPAKGVLLDILDTPISPELLPPDAQGKIAQYTEDLVGPYALHDFFLYYTVRFGFSPRKIYCLACRSFAEEFDAQTIKKWLISFYRRFFTQQFKRNCLPDGVKVGSVSLGSRGDWRMPSDASMNVWLSELETL